MAKAASKTAPKETKGAKNTAPAAPPVQTGPQLLFEERAGLPLVTFNVTFRVGASDDPKGKEGLAELTAAVVRQGGVKAFGRQPARTRAQVEETLFPLAASIDVGVEKEQTQFDVTTTIAEADRVLEMFAQVILAPAMSADEFARLKRETLDSLTKQWPREDQEELGKAALDFALYGAGHPYAHVGEGTVASVKALKLEDVRDFYRKHYTLSRVTVGVGGTIAPAIRTKVTQLFGRLPAQGEPVKEIPAAPKQEGLSLLIVQGPFQAVGVHLGLPLGVTRADHDFAPLYLAATAFGKHRSFVGRLMHVVREERGLNYGTYAYVEDFPGGGHRQDEPTQAARSRQAFTMWGRPTPPENGCFLLKQMYRELVKLSEDGLSDDEFTLAQSHLVGTLPMFKTAVDRQLGYAIDGLFYGIGPDPLERLLLGVKGAKRGAVNDLLKKRLDVKNARIVVTTSDAERFKKELLSGTCSITYQKGITKGSDIVSEDKEISRFKVPVSEVQLRTLKSDELFSGVAPKGS